MLQRLGIRGKLLAAVAVPTIVLLFAASFVVLNAAATYSEGRRSTELVDLVDPGTGVVTAVQTERAEVGNYLNAIIDGETARLEARSNVNGGLAVLRTAALEDPSLAPIVDQIVEAVAGANGEPGLEQMRAMAVVAPVEGGFPVWPDGTQTQTASDTFERVAQEVADAANLAPVNETGNVARGLPVLIRAEGRATKALFDEARTSAAALPDLFSATDRSGAVFEKGASRIAPNADNQILVNFLGGVSSGLGNLAEMRERIRTGSVQQSLTDSAYASIIGNLLKATREASNIIGDRSLSNSLKAYVSIGELVEQMRAEELYVVRKVKQGYWRLGESVRYQPYYFGSNNALLNAQSAVALVPGVTPVPKFGISYDPQERNGYDTIRDRINLDPTDRALIDQRQNEWPVQVEEEITVYRPILGQLSSVVKARAAEVERNSLVQTLATALIAVLAVTASIIAALAISRRIVNPLRRLTTTATAVRQELPRLVERVAMPGQTVDVSEVQIPVESRDEVGRLAEAFNSVNAATLAIAAEQAALRGSISEMFVNVARRDQVLLNRQLASIDEMERTEDNQSTLTKLFALDHLATRMRRNSESLLVLAGIDTGRRLRRPMPLSDVIRTASSEIELYERIQLELDVDPSMLGHSALTAAHLFAELLENATVFSDPGTQVVVRTMERDGAFIVTVTDRGIGMTSTELGEANGRVASTAASEILGAQRLGLFVVGRIARRIGARVHLESSEGKGTEATIFMPASLFDPSVTYDQGHTSPSTQDAEIHAPAALVHHDIAAEEISAPVENTRGLSAYTPTVIQEGTSLFGRPADAPDQLSQPAPLAPRGVPEPARASELDHLVAEDLAAAPPVVAFDLEEYTEGTTDVGLPTRRRRAAAPTDSAQDTNSIIALPQRASDEQLSALRSATTSGFTPILAADEVSPESAEARSRVFRGFRPLRGMEGGAEALAPDAESLGHAVRRGVPVPDAPVETASQITLAPEAPEAPEAHPAPRVADEFEPDGRAVDRASEVLTNFAADDAGRRGIPQPNMRQSSLIQAGYVEEGTRGSDNDTIDNEPAVAMLVPQLEEDDVPAAPSPAQRETPVVGATWRDSDHESAGVSAVSLDDPSPAQAPAAVPVYRSPLYPAPAANAWQQQLPEVAMPSAPMPAAPMPAAPMPAAPPMPQAAPVAPVQWQQTAPQGMQAQQRVQAPQEAQFEPDPITSVPSLDDLIMGGAKSPHSEDRSGFFARLFGRQAKGGQPQQSQTPYVAPRGSATDFVNTTPAQSWTAPTLTPDSRTVVDAPRAFEAPPLQETAPQRDNYSGGFLPPATEPPAVQDYGQHVTPIAETQFGSDEISQPWTTHPVASQPAPSPYGDGQGYGFSPGQPRGDEQRYGVQSREEIPFVQPHNQGAQPGFGPQDHGTVYSPDQLASPLGWETAGASALQAAAPESATEYRPVVQISPHLSSQPQDDFASAVFSELSSLAAERPKVETTRAGLAKRTPVAREEVTETPVQAVASPPRDAEAVRSRFSAFYSGTQRARDDVHDFNESTQGSLTEP